MGMKPQTGTQNWHKPPNCQTIIDPLYNIGLFQKKYTPPPPMDGKLEILAGGGEDSSGNQGGRRDLNRKILPWGSVLTLTSIDIFQPL